jgi:hypothetical protein
LNHKKYFFYNDLFWKKVGRFGKEWGRFDLLPFDRLDTFSCIPCPQTENQNNFRQGTHEND